MLFPPPTPSKGGKQPVFSPPLEGVGGGVRSLHKNCQKTDIQK